MGFAAILTFMFEAVLDETFSTIVALGWGVNISPVLRIKSSEAFGGLAIVFPSADASGIETFA